MEERSRPVSACTPGMHVRAPSEVYAPRAKIRTEIAAITGRPRETGIFIIRGHLNTAVQRRRRVRGWTRGEKERERKKGGRGGQRGGEMV